MDVRADLKMEHATQHAPFYHAPFYRTPLLCIYCHAQWADRLPIFIIRDDKQEVPLYAAAYYEVPLKRVMTVFKDKANVSSLMVLYHLMKYVKRPQGINADMLY